MSDYKVNYKVRKNFTTDPSRALQEILENRGVENVNDYINPTEECELDPFLLEYVKEGVEMLHKHLEMRSKILMVVDSDTDGVTSSSVLWLYIKQWYPEANLSFTVHEGKQHGLDDKIDWIEEQDFNLIICPDSASYDKEEMERIIDKGTEVLVLDHHEPLLNEDGSIHMLYNPHAVIINNQLSPNYPNKSLCGAGVVYKFCEALDTTFSRADAQNYLDLVALGEIADVMFQGTSETRYLITEGLKNIRNDGFKALLEAQAFSLKDKAQEPYYGLTPIDVAFYIGPLINAITRVGTLQERETLFLAFIEPLRKVQSTKRGAKEGDWEYACQQNARVAGNARNRQNKAKERAIEILEARAQKEGLLDNNVIIIPVEPEDKIPQELTGLIAMAFVSKYGKPCLIGRVNDNDALQGSIRNNENFEALPALKSYLEETGLFSFVAGHENSAGFGIQEDKVSTFISLVNEQFSPDDFQNCYLVDYALDAYDIELNPLFMILAQHPEYFGNGVDEIKVVVKGIKVSSPFFMGANKDSTKISCNGVDYVRFKDENFVEAVKMFNGGEMTVIGRLNLNTFAGKTSVQLFIDDYEFFDNRYEF